MNWSADEKQIVDGTLNEPRDELLLALDGFSVEIGVHEAESLDRLAPLLPDNTQVFLNVLPNERIEERIDTCKTIGSLNMSPVPHIAARPIISKAEVREILNRYVQEGGVSEFLVIAGDYSQPSGEVEDALGFIDAIGTGVAGIRRIGISGYPEGHPQISDDILGKALEDKIVVLQTLGIEPFIVTQFSFNADAIVRWCENFHSRHPDIKVQVGVPGPAKLTTLIRFAQRCGVVSSMKKLKGLPVSSSLKLMQRIPPLNQTVAVGNYKKEQNDNATMHFFTFGGPEASLEWVRSEIAERTPG